MAGHSESHVRSLTLGRETAARKPQHRASGKNETHSTSNVVYTFMSYSAAVWFLWDIQSRRHTTALFWHRLLLGIFREDRLFGRGRSFARQRVRLAALCMTRDSDSSPGLPRYVAMGPVLGDVPLVRCLCVLPGCAHLPGLCPMFHSVAERLSDGLGLSRVVCHSTYTFLRPVLAVPC